MRREARNGSPPGVPAVPNPWRGGRNASISLRPLWRLWPEAAWQLPGYQVKKADIMRRESAGHCLRCGKAGNGTFERPRSFHHGRWLPPDRKTAMGPPIGSLLSSAPKGYSVPAMRT
jgi:hypothetical protein